uniref:Uncharacterized protein n=1 Tax=Tanacetum cinerariifolium TaxID=118510 RepID=A0A699IC55_TANCI|nr:hypothetical protein [Tanacetum cinerariifolium]
MDENANPATAQGEHSNVEENAAIPDTSEGEHKSDNANISAANEETTLVIYQTANLKTTEDDTDYDELDKNHLSKKFKIMTPILNFPTPTPLCSIPSKHMMKTAPHQDSVQEFTDKDLGKGKGVDIEEPINVLVPFVDEGGSNPKMPSLKPFMNIEGVSTQEEFIKQLTEIKRLADLRAQEEELEKALKKLRMLGFSEWLEVHALASKKSSKSIDSLLQSLKSKFQWVLNQVKNLGLPPPPALATFEMTTKDKKRKRNETLKEVFIKERIDVDGTQRNITPPSGVVGKECMVIREPEAGFFYFNVNFDLAFQRESEFHLTSTVQLIKLLNRINLDSPEAREMYKIMEIEIESKDDVNKAKEIARTNSDGLGM